MSDQQIRWIAFVTPLGLNAKIGSQWSQGEVRCFWMWVSQSPQTRWWRCCLGGYLGKRHTCWQTDLWNAAQLAKFYTVPLFQSFQLPSYLFASCTAGGGLNATSGRVSFIDGERGWTTIWTISPCDKYISWHGPPEFVIRICFVKLVCAAQCQDSKSTDTAALVFHDWLCTSIHVGFLECCFK